MNTEIMNKMNDIEYGYLDKDGIIHRGSDDEFADNYVLETPDEVLTNKIGVCWDQVELERKLFSENNIKFNTYFIVHYDDNTCPTHTFLIYEYNNKYYWFEHSWEIHRGIYEYDDELSAIKDIKKKFIESEIKDEYNPMNLCIYKYNKPKYGIGCLDFYKHCESGENIIID